MRPTTKKSTLASIFLVVFIDMLGIGILIPIVPMLIIPDSIFRITPLSWTDAENAVMYGWLVTTFPLALFFCAPILGQLSDRYGRRPVLAVSILVISISYMIIAIGLIVKSLWLIFAARLLAGAAGGNIAVAQAAIGDISTPENRAKNFGLIGMAFGIGFVLGPFLGGKLSDPSLSKWFTPATPFWVASMLSLINVVCVLKFLKETLAVKISSRIDLTRPFRNIVKVFLYPGLRNVIPATFLFNAGFTFYTTFWGVVLAGEFGVSQSQIGNFYAYMGIMIVLAQGLVVRNLSGKVEDYKILRYSFFGSGLCIAGYYFIPAGQMLIIYLIPPFLATANALTMSFGTALITRVTPDNIRGEVMGVNSSVNALAMAIPGLLGGYAAQYGARLPILIGGITIILGGIIFNYLFDPKKIKIYK